MSDNITPIREDVQVLDPADTQKLDDPFAGDVYDQYPDFDSPTDDLPPVDDSPVQEVEFVPPTDYSVMYGTERFVIAPPAAGTTLAFVRVIGELGLNAQRKVGSYLKGMFLQMVQDAQGKTKQDFAPPIEATIFALMAAMDEQFLRKLSIIALFGGSQKEYDQGVRFFQSLPDSELRIAPIVTAISYRIMQSDDLAEAMGNLQVVRGAVTLITSKMKK